MFAAVIYEEEYELYGQHYHRSIQSVVLQRDDESERDFGRRVRTMIARDESRFSWFDYEMTEVIR